MSSAPPAETAALTDLCASWRGFFREGKLFFTYRRCRRCGQVYAPLYFTPEQLAELYGRMEDNTAGLPEAPLAETQRGYFDLLGGDFPRNGGFLELGPDIGPFDAGRDPVHGLFPPLDGRAEPRRPSRAGKSAAREGAHAC